MSTPPAADRARVRRAVAVVVAARAAAVAVALQVACPPALVALLPSPDMHELHADFDTFRASAVALVHGGDIYDTPAKLRNLNPPLLSVLLAPSALLDALTAYRVFAALTLLMVLGAVLAVARRAAAAAHDDGRGRARRARVVAAARDAAAGQIYGLLLVGLAAAGSPSVAATRCSPQRCTASTVALKPSLAPLLLLPLVLRRWRPALAGWGAAAARHCSGCSPPDRPAG